MNASMVLMKPGLQTVPPTSPNDVVECKGAAAVATYQQLRFI